MRTVLVTGASGAIGSAVAEDLATTFDVAEHRGRTDRPLNLILDNVNPDILVNCIGTQANARVMNLDTADWYNVINTNLTTAFTLTKAVLPHMIQQRYGRIIHMSSMAGRLPLVGASAYTASKAGLEGFVRSAAADVATKGVTINCVAPGALNVGMGANLDPIAAETFMARIPTRRFGRVDDVIHAVRFLIGAPYVTGQSIPVDGGMW